MIRKPTEEEIEYEIPKITVTYTKLIGKFIDSIVSESIENGVNQNSAESAVLVCLNNLFATMAVTFGVSKLACLESISATYSRVFYDMRHPVGEEDEESDSGEGMN